MTQINDLESAAALTRSLSNALEEHVGKTSWTTLTSHQKVYRLTVLPTDRVSVIVNTIAALPDPFPGFSACLTYTLKDASTGYLVTIHAQKGEPL